MTNGMMEMAFVFKAVDNLSGAARNMTRNLEGLQTRTQKIKAGLSSLGNAVLPMVGYEIYKLGQESVDLAVKFDSAMSKVNALTGSIDTSSDKWSKFKDTIENVGKTTEFTASQAADAATFMAMAGFKLQDIEGGLRDVTNLATVGFTDLGTAADITTNIMTGFGLSVKDLVMVNDSLVATFTSSNVTLSMLGETMKYVAPVAHAVGWSLQQVAAAAGLLGNAGIQGSMAGTSMRMALVQLLSPSDKAKDVISKLGVNMYDASGNIRPLVDILHELETAGASTSDVMTIFGSRAGTSMLALLGQGSAVLQSYTDEIYNADGATTKMAETIRSNMGNTLAQTNSRLQSIQIEIGTALYPVILELSNLMADTIAPLLRDTIVPILIDMMPAIRGIATGLNMVLKPLQGQKEILPALVYGYMLYKTSTLASSIAGTTMSTMLATRLNPGLESNEILAKRATYAQRGLGLAIAGVAATMGALTAKSDKQRAMFSALTGVTWGLAIANFAAAAGASAYSTAVTFGVAAAAIAAGIYLVSSAINKTKDDARNMQVPHAAVGAKIEKSGLMVVHEGEMVEPAAKIRRLNAAEDIGSGSGTNVSITVNAGFGTDGNEVAKKIIQVMKQYRISGGI